MHSVKSVPAKLLGAKSEIFHYDQEFVLEEGVSLPGLEIAYTTHGTLTPAKDNVVWVFHALTANADPFEWWPGLVGDGHLINPEDHYIVCANMLGSCYGSTGPDHNDAVTGEKYGLDFPTVTIKDMVNAHRLLKVHLGIEKIYLGIGGSMGGQQLLQWAVEENDLFEHVCAIATNARHSAWGIAFNTAQRMAMEADPTLQEKYPGAGEKGLKAARAIAMLSYRNQNTYRKTQTDFENKIDDFKASSYQYYQGEKLVRRFTPHAYWYLSKAMDSHNVGRGRRSVPAALKSIQSKSLIIGLRSDILFPVAEQRFIAKNMKNATFQMVESLYGHDGFLVEANSISKHIEHFLTSE
ncbi:homoserine O-acetyltransferase [Fulvivirga sp. M361]|uniref:homoserine O-acetyltransferase family protein n=1 Tax=Fulvivirga sp. M361 TaxID=2594266 RepID=UPI00117B8642|nr:homoserine O-acetyltransferase [Fulvivirga sp. M361]TRX61358.1 homoserine O-acetyltransferase [Fulvivirga sp. M361]